jgi:MOSC domain-containing protein YiiM
MMGRIVSINQSRKKGTPKSPVHEGVLVPSFGLEGDAHAGPGERQVSLLMVESIDQQDEIFSNKEGAERIRLVPGIYAENLTTEGIDLSALAVGDELHVGEEVSLRVTRIGKECHTGCAIYRKVGDCIMPREGIFCEVLEGGPVHVGDSIEKIG